MENKSPFLDDDNFFKSNTLYEDGMLKSVTHKYIKRTGTPGNYKYWYKDASGKLVSSKNYPIDTNFKKEQALSKQSEEKKGKVSLDTIKNGIKRYAEKNRHHYMVGRYKLFKNSNWKTGEDVYMIRSDEGSWEVFDNKGKFLELVPSSFVQHKMEVVEDSFEIIERTDKEKNKQ